MLFFFTDLYITVRRFGKLLSLHQLKKPLDVTRDLKTFKLKRCACCMRVTRENLSTCKALVPDDGRSVSSCCLGLSHHPSCHKRSVVNTLLLCARNIASTSKGKREEAQRVKAVLRENNCPSATKFASFLPATENHQQSFCSTQAAG